MCCNFTEVLPEFDLTAGYDPLTAVITKGTILWDVKPCNSVIHRSFGGTYWLHLQDERVSYFNNQEEDMLAAYFSLTNGSDHS
jgi:hypothetical protein